MKRILVAVLGIMLMSGVCYASQTQKTLIDGVQLGLSTTATEAEMYVGDAKRVSFFVVNDSTKATEGVTCTVTAAVSIDGEKWQDLNWSDVAGGSTKQTSEALHGAEVASLGGFAGDGVYYAWFDEDMTMPLIRFRVTLDSTAAGQIGVAEYNKITITVIEDK